MRPTSRGASSLATHVALLSLVGFSIIAAGASKPDRSYSFGKKRTIANTTTVAADETAAGTPMQVGPVVANDFCDGAIQVGIPSLTGGSTVDATPDPLGGCGSTTTSPGVWYRVTGLGTTMTASTCVFDTDFDTRLSVFCGGCEELVCIGESNDLEPPCPVAAGASQLSWCAAAGVEYLILVHGNGSATGSFTVVVGDDLTTCDDAVDCSAAEPEGACCIGAQCVPTTADTCSTSGGEFLGVGSVCGVESCEVDPIGACCIAGECVTVLESICGISGGSFLGEEILCDGNPCAPPAEGACCIADTCAVMSADLCEVSGGSYLGDDTTCDGDPCAPPAEGACCIGESCAEMTEALCGVSGGSYLGDDTTCDGEPCAVPAEGACCVDGSCVILTEALCGVSGGAYLGDDSSCDGEPCLGAAEGACCFDAVCEMMTEQQCASAGGSYLGDGTSCKGGPCTFPAEGACCIDGVCEVLTEQVCTQLEGTYLGDDTGCSPDPCVREAEGGCCVGLSCSIETEAVCREAGGDYLGDDSDCEACALEAALDILPGRCPNSWNSRSRGVVKVALLGDADFDLRSVDRASLQLYRITGADAITPIVDIRGLRPRLQDRGGPGGSGKPCDCERSSYDGHADLIMCFRSEELAWLLDGTPRGAAVALTLSAELDDGRTVIARDCIVISR